MKLIAIFNLFLYLEVLSLPVKDLPVLFKPMINLSRKDYEHFIIRAIETVFPIKIDFINEWVLLQNNKLIFEPNGIILNVDLLRQSNIHLINRERYFDSYKIYLKETGKFYLVKIPRTAYTGYSLAKFISEISAFYLIENFREQNFDGPEGIVSLIDLNFVLSGNGSIVGYLVYNLEQSNLFQLYKSIKNDYNSSNIQESHSFMSHSRFYIILKKIIVSILKTTAFLENVGIIHTDLNLGSISISCGNTDLGTYSLKYMLSKCVLSELKVKLTNFHNHYRKSHNEKHRLLNMPNYRAPENILGYDLDYGLDVWAIGVIIFELYSGEIWCSWKENDLKDNRIFLKCIEERLGIHIEDEIKNLNLSSSEKIEIDFLDNVGVIRKININEYIEYRNEINGIRKEMISISDGSYQNLFLGSISREKPKKLYSEYIKDECLLNFLKKILVIDYKNREKAGNLLNHFLFICFQ